MDTKNSTGRRGKRLLAAALVAAALSIGGAITATAATDHQPTPAACRGFCGGGDFFGWDGGYFLAAGVIGGGRLYGYYGGF